MQSENTQGAAALADAADVQAFIRARTRRGVQVGPFSILFSPSDPGLYANYATPEDGARPTPSEIIALEAAFRTRHRTPRLEYVPDAAPAVEPTLLAAGFEVELRPPLMTRRAQTPCPQPALDGFDFNFVRDPEPLVQAVTVAAEAFGGTEADAQWLMETSARGGRVLLARHAETGEACGVGAFIPPIDGVTEVVGIGVRPAFRRRGLARAVTARLADEAFESGCRLVFLSAAGEGQAAIYARAGFVRRAPMLFLVKA